MQERPHVVSGSLLEEGAHAFVVLSVDGVCSTARMRGHRVASHVVEALALCLSFPARGVATTTSTVWHGTMQVGESQCVTNIHEERDPRSLLHEKSSTREEH